MSCQNTNAQPPPLHQMHSWLDLDYQKPHRLQHIKQLVADTSFSKQSSMLLKPLLSHVTSLYSEAEATAVLVSNVASTVLCSAAQQAQDTS